MVSSVSDLPFSGLASALLDQQKCCTDCVAHAGATCVRCQVCLAPSQLKELIMLQAALQTICLE